MEEARAVLRQFLPRFNRCFQVSAQCSEPAFQPLQPDLRLEQVLCFKHHRRVARDNTVKFQKRTLQLLPNLERPSYAGDPRWWSCKAWTGDCRYSMTDASSLPGKRLPVRQLFARPKGNLPAVPVPVPDPGLPSPASANTPELQNSRGGPEDPPSAAVGDAAMTELQVTTSPGKPTFLQRERWKAVQQAKLRWTLDPGDGQGVGNSPQHSEEIHRCRESADAPVPHRFNRGRFWYHLRVGN